MTSRKLYHFIFPLHRYIGLVVGLLIVIVGITGSILVFESEIDHFLLHRQIGSITPQGERLPVEVVLTQVQDAYRNQPDLKVQSIDIPKAADASYRVWLESKDEKWTEVNIHPYTGAMLGTRQWENTLIGVTYRLHYELLAGDIGLKIVGIVALLLLILSLTGLMLWPGWRKLIAGFKIKWNAHIKRLSFDLHKVAGVISVVLLALIAFTGFCWNFYEVAEPAIYAATLTPKPVEPKSQPIPGQSPLPLDNLREVLRRADAALPEATTTSISLPTTPDGVFRINKRLPGEREDWGRSQVYLDQYTGQVLKVRDARSLPLGDQVLDAFGPMHYGTFGGLPTRILYFLVGLAPVLLLGTGAVMWGYRRREQRASQLLSSSQKRKSSVLN